MKSTRPNLVTAAAKALPRSAGSRHYRGASVHEGQGNDPYGEHDCASFDLSGQSFVWTIYYYDETCTYRSRCVRSRRDSPRAVMLAQDYYAPIFGALSFRTPHTSSWTSVVATRSLNQIRFGPAPQKRPNHDRWLLATDTRKSPLHRLFIASCSGRAY